jgi:hypothetical protein
MSVVTADGRGMVIASITQTKRTNAGGNIMNTNTNKENPQNQTRFYEIKRVDVVGRGHTNKNTGKEVPTPHVHEKDIPDGVRPARNDEIPKRRGN